jgi:hypothetical protein
MRRATPESYQQRRPRARCETGRRGGGGCQGGGQGGSCIFNGGAHCPTLLQGGKAATPPPRLQAARVQHEKLSK